MLCNYLNHRTWLNYIYTHRLAPDQGDVLKQKIDNLIRDDDARNGKAIQRKAGAAFPEYLAAALLHQRHIALRHNLRASHAGYRPGIGAAVYQLLLSPGFSHTALFEGREQRRLLHDFCGRKCTGLRQLGAVRLPNTLPKGFDDRP